MATLSAWIDRRIASLSEWLWLWLRPNGQLALAGNTLAGVHDSFHLPLERKGHLSHDPTRAAEHQSASDGMATTGLPSVSGGQAGVDCSSPQYCNMHGNPCACCGGSDASCPSGTARGAYWSYCCSGRTRWFTDCCGGSACPASCPWCANSNQPNWCGGAGGNVYRCTLAEDKGPCGY